MNKMNTITSYF